MVEFVTEAVLKRDVFSETRKGYLKDAASTPAICRVVSVAPWWSKPVALFLAHREITTMRALNDEPGTPRLFKANRDIIIRSWTEGVPLHLAKPKDAAFYRDAMRLLRALRRAKVTHNDLAKPQNWLMTPEGKAALIDFQLASRHWTRGPLYRMMAYEDFRHLLKQMRAFAPDLLTPTARRILDRRSPMSRLWMASGKKVYNFVTRKLLHWSDGEGTHDRIDQEGDAILASLKAIPGVRDVAMVPYPLPARGAGLYAFVETDGSVDAGPLRTAAPQVNLIQPVLMLPRDETGTVRIDILHAIAMNQLPLVERLCEGDTMLSDIADHIAAGRLNFSDRRIVAGVELADMGSAGGGR